MPIVTGDIAQAHLITTQSPSTRLDPLRGSDPPQFVYHSSLHVGIMIHPRSIPIFLAQTYGTCALMTVMKIGANIPHYALNPDHGIVGGEKNTLSL
jgi:hypothetical protein